MLTIPFLANSSIPPGQCNLVKRCCIRTSKIKKEMLWIIIGSATGCCFDALANLFNLLFWHIVVMVLIFYHYNPKLFQGLKFSLETKVYRRAEWLRCETGELRVLGSNPAQVNDCPTIISRNCAQYAVLGSFSTGRTPLQLAKSALKDLNVDT